MKGPFSKLAGRGGWLAVLLIPLAVMGSEAAAWWWMHPSHAGESIEVLSYHFPAGRPGCVGKPMDPKIAEILECDAGQVGKVTGESGQQVEVSFFEWDGTDEQGLMQAFGHSPDVCMGVAGYEVDEFLPSRHFQIGGRDLMFDVTRFLDGHGDPFYIFKAPWADGTWGLNLLREGPQGKSFREFKFQAVRHRWKPRFARVLMGGVSGFQREEDAWEFFRISVLVDLEFTKQVPGDR